MVMHRTDSVSRTRVQEQQERRARREKKNRKEIKRWRRMEKEISFCSKIVAQWEFMSRRTNKPVSVYRFDSRNLDSYWEILRSFRFDSDRETIVSERNFPSAAERVGIIWNRERSRQLTYFMLHNYYHYRATVITRCAPCVYFKNSPRTVRLP